MRANPAPGSWVALFDDRKESHRWQSTRSRGEICAQDGVEGDPGRPKFPAELRGRIREVYFTKPLTMKQIARAFECSYNTVFEAVHEHAAGGRRWRPRGCLRAGILREDLRGSLPPRGLISALKTPLEI